jgi:hypothetical protein
MRSLFALSVAWILLTAPECKAAGRRFATQGNDRLAIVAADGSIEWEMPWSGIHDIHQLPSGRLMVQRGAAEIVEIDPSSKEIVWSYDSAAQGGNAGQPVEVHSFQPLDDGRVMIAESGSARIIEVNRAGKIEKIVPLKVEHPHPHTDTRLVRKLDDGHYLVCHEGDGAVREYDGQGEVVWEYKVPMFGKSPADGHGPEGFGNKCFAAVRLENGNTLISTGNGHSVIEVTPEKKVVWQLQQSHLPGITLAWVTTLEVLPNGHYVIGNCHAGPENPTLIEIDPATNEVVWQFDGHERFGNSMSNSLLLDVNGARR